MLTESHEIMSSYNASTFITYLNENNDVSETRAKIYKYFLDTFNLHYSLYDNIKEEYFWDSSCKLRWPIGWYLGHTASFYNNKLRMNNIINRSQLSSTHHVELYKQFDYIFAQGVDEMDWNDFVPQYPSSHWPEVSTVKTYCKNTRDIIANIILNAPLNTLPIDKSMPIWWTILMGIEHERIHLETSAMLIRQFPLNKCKNKDDLYGVWTNEFNEEYIPPHNQLLYVEGREIKYGRGANLVGNNDGYDFFGWDVEYGHYTVNVPSFNASKYMVSNYEYYEFYKDNGYKQKELWSDEGWQWVQETKTNHPKFWIYHNEPNGKNKTGSFKLRNLFTEIDLKQAWNRPVITNHFEAEAFIAWKSKKMDKKNLRLITEDEWYILRTLINNENIRQWSQDWFKANINFYYFSTEAAIDLFEFGDTGFYDVVGNVHHHTLSVYHPFNEYVVDPLYVDFSTPFFNDSYYLMKGGSYLSSGNMAMIYNRCQWFRSHYFQATGIRYVESERTIKDIIKINEKERKTTNEYFKNTDESDELCNEYIHWQYNDNKYRDMVYRIIKENVEFIKNDMNVLDIGCNVGGVTYELAKYFNKVIGIDDRARFIGIANQIQQNYKLEYFMKNEFGKDKYHYVTLKDLNMDNITDRVQFIHDKELNFLDNDKYDLIIGHNAFERYRDKLSKFELLSNKLNDNATIILFEDYLWNTDGIDVIYEMNKIFGDDIILKHKFDIEPISRQKYESSRIKQYYSFHCTIWIKNGRNINSNVPKNK